MPLTVRSPSPIRYWGRRSLWLQSSELEVMYNLLGLQGKQGRPNQPKTLPLTNRGWNPATPNTEPFKEYEAPKSEKCNTADPYSTCRRNCHLGVEDRLHKVETPNPKSENLSTQTQRPYRSHSKPWVTRDNVSLVGILQTFCKQPAKATEPSCCMRKSLFTRAEIYDTYNSGTN